MNDADLVVDISDALSERDKVKFTVHTRVSGGVRSLYQAVRDHEMDRSSVCEGENVGLAAEVMIGCEQGPWGCFFSMVCFNFCSIACCKQQCIV